ncbi:hypothetical protein FOZ63_009862, partial [Perkinsus olseni]
ESPSRPQTARPPRRTSPRYGLSQSVDGVGFPQTARVVRDSTTCSVSGPVPETADILDESLRMYLSSPESPQTRYEFEKISKGVYKYGSKRVVIAMKNDKPMVRIGGGFTHLGNFLETEERHQEVIEYRAGYHRIGGRNPLNSVGQRKIRESI